MNAERWQQAKQILRAALSCEPDQQQALLQQSCNQDAELLCLVESVLHHNHAPADFLQPPVNGSAIRAWSMMADTLMVGRTLGAYRVASVLGSGGMGTVYRAVRADNQYHKEVAIKLIKPTLASAELLARFHQERQILANLEHAYIAHLVDGGVTPEGLPYLVMEFADGDPITRHCDERRCSVTQRLQLFGLVCSAIEHAHHKSIVHGDLKPGNILVTRNDVPKILDFGIGRLADQPVDLSPGGATPLATPPYASPEQIRGAAPSTGSDIYSLGVVLYELLTGLRPVRADAAGTRAHPEGSANRQPTQAPSAAVAGLRATAGTTCLNRHTTRKQLAQQLKGDLDAIVLKALHHDPRQRYASVHQFAADVDRYLGHEPVSARRATAGYRSTKFFKRHRTASLGVSTALLAMVVYIVCTFCQVGMAKTAIHRGTLSSAMHLDRLALKHIEMDQLQDASAYLDEALRSRRGIYGDHHSEVAVSCTNQANVLWSQGAFSAAEGLYRQALAIRRRWDDQRPQDLANHLDAFGSLLRIMGRFTEAESMHRQALQVLRRNPGAHRALAATCKNNLAALLQDMGAYGEAESLFRDSLEIRRQLYGESHQLVAISLNNLAALLQERGNYGAAEPLYRRALEFNQVLPGGSSRHLANSLNNLASVRRLQGDYDSAEQLYRQALSMRRAVLGPDHWDVAFSLNGLALLEQDRGAHQTAVALFRQAIHIRAQTLPPHHWRLAKTESQLAESLLHLGHYDQAENLLLESVDVLAHTLGREHPRIQEAVGRLVLLYERWDKPLRAEMYRSRTPPITTKL